MLSIVIPLLNEEGSLRELHASIVRAMAAAGEPYEVLFVDDGSTDNSWATIQSLVAVHPNLRGIRFRRNFGKAAALAAGFEAAKGEIVVTMDADLQDDPKEIPRFIAKMNEGTDVVSGWKRVRHDPWHKTIPSVFFNRMVSRLTGVKLHDHNCGFKAYRRQIFDEVKLYGELHRFVPVLAASRGWRVSEIEVEHHARTHGHSKYGLSRLPKGFLDLLTIYFLTGFSQRPLHLIGSAGLIAFVLGGGGLLLLASIKIIRLLLGEETLHLHSKASFYFCITSVLLGAQFLVAGLLAELITSLARREISPASIAETAESNRSAGASDQSMPSNLQTEGPGTPN
jgi:glycosyltransferase involved in cell wall biosynthesis